MTKIDKTDNNNKPKNKKLTNKELKHVVGGIKGTPGGNGEPTSDKKTQP